MGIHAIDVLSHLAYDAREPIVPERYDYDEYVVQEWDEKLQIFRGVFNTSSWAIARLTFIRFFLVENRKVKLIGRVFN